MISLISCVDSFVSPWTPSEAPAFDEQGYRLMSALRAQGMPSTAPRRAVPEKSSFLGGPPGKPCTNG